MYSKATVKIESRVHLLSTLAEAAELEHNLMCMYLYSLFSLKTSTNEGLTPEEMEAVNVWRKTILDVCVVERLDEILDEVQTLRSDVEDQATL